MASRTAFPCGSSTAFFGVTITLNLIRVTVTQLVHGTRVICGARRFAVYQTGSATKPDRFKRSSLLDLNDRRGARFAQLEAARPHRFLKRSALIIEQKMNATSLEGIGNTKEDLELVEWLHEKLGRAGAKGTPFCFFVYVSGQNDDWEENFAIISTQRFENGKAVYMRHHQIKQH